MSKTASGKVPLSRRTPDWLPAVLFVLALLMVAFGYGYLSATRHYPPDGLIRLARDTVADWSKHWENDLGIEPNRNLVSARPGRQRVVTYHPDQLAQGLRLVAGLTAGRKALNGAVLLHADGTEMHYWPVDYALLDPEGPDPENVLLHGIAVFKDGSIVVNFDEGRVLARLDACGKIVWNNRGWYHHAVSHSWDGTIWALNWVEDSDTLDQLDVANGQLIQRISLMKDIILPHGSKGKFLAMFPEGEDQLVTPVDPFHTNDVDVLSPDLAPAFPGFSTGDLLISLRSVNLVAVVDAKSHDLKWSRTGPWYRQHDPDFLPDGTISVFDNNMSFGASRIVAISPVTGKYRTVYEGREGQPFYSWRRGQHKQLYNGNLLITESERGRVFEVDSNGEMVWEYNNIYDDTRNGVVTRGMLLPDDFFNQGALHCGSQSPDKQ